MKKHIQMPALERPLPCDVSALSAFLYSVDTFILSTKDGTILRYAPANMPEANALAECLRYAGVRDLNK